jgi:hypothetical protein
LPVSVAAIKHKIGLASVRSLRIATVASDPEFALSYVNEDFSMSSYEWMELQGLINDIELSRSRLVEARRRGDRGRVRALGDEIEQAEKSRLALIAHISTNIVTIPGPASKATDGHGSRQGSAPIAKAVPKKTEEKPAAGEVARDPEPTLRRKPREDAGSGPFSAKDDSVEGETIVWDRLTPQDFQRVKDELGVRRGEMLARHSEELKELHAEQTQLETLEQAIEMFLRKANRSMNAAA